MPAVGHELIGRDAEVAALTRFLEPAPDSPVALVLEGEAGIGKTSRTRSRCQRSSVSGLGMSDRQSGLGRTRLIAASTQAIGGLPARSSDLALKHPELVAQGQDFGEQPGLRPAADDQGFQHEADHKIEEVV